MYNAWTWIKCSGAASSSSKRTEKISMHYITCISQTREWRVKQCNGIFHSFVTFAFFFFSLYHSTVPAFVIPFLSSSSLIFLLFPFIAFFSLPCRTMHVDCQCTQRNLLRALKLVWQWFLFLFNKICNSYLCDSVHIIVDIFFSILFMQRINYFN